MYANSPNRIGQDNNAPKLSRPSEVGEIGQQAPRLESTISSLAVSLDMLSQRLSPILHSPSPSNPEGLTTGPRDTEMGEFLHTSNQRLDNLSARVEEITSRVAL